jgi:hypothetical protein
VTGRERAGAAWLLAPAAIAVAACAAGLPAVVVGLMTGIALGTFLPALTRRARHRIARMLAPELRHTGRQTARSRR